MTKVSSNISVAMTSYNGEKYIAEQIKSILNNLDKNDEIIISDDGSIDETINIINSFRDNRIKLLSGPKKGIIKNFENALKNCSNEFIFLCDQDDVWEEHKKEIILKTFKSTNCCCIVHNAYVMDQDLEHNIYESYFDFRKIRHGKLSNIIKPGYLGCCMAFKKEMLEHILPIPSNIEMHDRWIGAVCNKFGTVKFIDDKLIKYRRHNDNASKMQRNGILVIIKNRYNLVKSLLFRK